MSTISDIFNRPPAISEDTLQYALYPPPAQSDSESVTSFAACILAFVDELLQNFIWHRDSFEFKVVKSPESSDRYIIQGIMRVGDSVDDEWCVVWLLKQISAKWVHLAISVFDSDGEFLLIEAADVLPSWVKPSNSENRVWIYNSRLHLVPLSHVSPPSRRKHRRKLPGLPESDDEGLSTKDEGEWISADDATELVRNPLTDTFAPDLVEHLVWQRVSGYPVALKDHVHITKAWIPVDIAKALAANPSLVQRAVEAFYTRDALQLRAAHRMSRFSPETSVLRPARMTRTAYAQLVGQKFFPPKTFGRWQERENTKEWRWRDVGMKIAVGFEMLYQETKARREAIETAESIDASKDALRRDPHYMKYLQNLASTDYFKGEIQGSSLWQALEGKAVVAYIGARREDASRPSFASQVNAAISQVASLPEVLDYEDKDDWLNIDVQDLDETLEKTIGGSKIQRKSDAMEVDDAKDDTEEERVASAQAMKLKELAVRMEEFVEGEGDIEGARFEDEAFSEEEFSDQEVAASEEEADETMDIQEMDEEEKAERQAAMDKLVPPLDPSEYGRMPSSYHSNSQRVTATTAKSDKVEMPVTAGKPSTQTTAEAKARERPIRPPMLPRDEYEGVDSDDETDEEGIDEESEEEMPQVVGEIEVDMADEEEEFLEFSRQELGISDEQWNDIIQDRKNRGAFLPASATIKQPVSKSEHVQRPKASGNASDQDSAPKDGKPGVNHNLDSFEAVMKAMDEELARARGTKMKAPAADPKGKGKARDFTIQEGRNIEAAMEAELSASLEQDDDGEGEDMPEENIDYNLIKNFLESFKSQGGLAGPVSSLAGRLQPEWKLPRDNS